MKANFCYSCWGVLGVLLSAPCLHGAIIFDTVAASGNEYVNTTCSLGQSFKTDAVNVRLTSVVLRLDAAIDPAGGFFVQILDATGASQTPNNVVATLSGPANPAAAGDYAYTPSTTLELSPNTFYWVVTGVSSGLSQYPWRRKVPAVIAVGSALGASDNYLIFGFGWSGPFADVDYCMQVNAEPVPGPTLAIAPDGSGGYFIRGAGRTGLSYRLQRTESMGAAWSSIATNTAPASGSLEFHDTAPPSGRAFYRTVQP